MSDIRIASRYAKSLMDLAIEKGLLEQVNLDMRTLQTVAKENSSLVNVFDSPVIKSDKKAAIVHGVFGNTFNKLTMMFADQVVKKRREMYLPLIAQEFVKQYNQRNGIQTATVTSATALSEGMKASVKEFIEKETNSRVDLKTMVNPDIIGGLVIRIEDTLYDSSIAKKLDQIKKELIHQN
ncbi:MAG TPA: ATP synthase F1 subunit delta [Bacteroidia bacterium]|nr:ATP synthase F1 subunit delta [Bacteroidia bacterium]